MLSNSIIRISETDVGAPQFAILGRDEIAHGSFGVIKPILGIITLNIADLFIAWNVNLVCKIARPENRDQSSFAKKEMLNEKEVYAIWGNDITVMSRKVLSSNYSSFSDSYGSDSSYYVDNSSESEIIKKRYAVMPNFGMSLNQYWELYKHNLNIFDVLSIMLQVCRQVLFMHEKGYVHCDIKPQNILVKIINGQIVVQVIDFGGVYKKSIESKQRYVSTIRYVPPERFLGANIASAFDVFALGVVFTDLLRKNVNYSSSLWHYSALNAYDGFSFFDGVVESELNGKKEKLKLYSRQLKSTISQKLALVRDSFLDDAIYENLKTTMTAMVSYHPENRPTLQKVIEILEEAVACSNIRKSAGCCSMF